VLLGRPTSELEALAKQFGQPAFRAKQLNDGIMKGARSIDDIPVVCAKHMHVRDAFACSDCELQ